MKKKVVSKKRVAKKGHKPPPDGAFDRMLETTGVEECAPGMSAIFASDKTTPLGWWQEIHGLGRNGLGCGEGPFWSVLEIVLPKPKLFIVAYSLETEDPADPSNQFYIRTIDWPKTSEEMSPKIMYDGGPQRCRDYDSGKFEDAIRDGIFEEPWLYFEFSDGDCPNIAFDPDSIRSFLQRVAKPGRTRPKDRKPFPRILKAIYTLDPDGLVGEIHTVGRDNPELEEALRRMVPGAFHKAEIGRQEHLAADELASDFSSRGCRCSGRTILRWAKKLGCEHRIGPSGCFLFPPKAQRQLYDAIHR